MDNKKKQNVVVVKTTGNSPVDMTASSNLISLAIEKGSDLDKLEKMLMLKERYDALEAKKAYHQAMANFKANPPKINKDKTVAYGNTKYNHASLANVTEKISEGLSKWGLSASWQTQQNGAIQITCKITHIKGHSEETTLSAPSDTSGSKNAIQAIGSTITYLERYTLLALTGLATFEQDDDGKTAEPIEYIDKAQTVQLVNLIAELKVDEKLFFQYMKIESLSKMPKDDFKKAVMVIEVKRKNTAK